MKDTLSLINWKFLAFAQVGATIGEFVNPIATQKTLLIGVLFVYALDWFTGIAASIKAGRPFSSSRMREAIPKLIAYFAVVALAAIATAILKSGEAPIPPGWAGLPVSGVLALIFTIETTSVLENAFEIVPKLKRGKLAEIFDGFSNFINQEAPAEIPKDSPL